MFKKDQVWIHTDQTQRSEGIWGLEVSTYRLLSAWNLDATSQESDPFEWNRGTEKGFCPLKKGPSYWFKSKHHQPVEGFRGKDPGVGLNHGVSVISPPPPKVHSCSGILLSPIVERGFHAKVQKPEVHRWTWHHLGWQLTLTTDSFKQFFSTCPPPSRLPYAHMSPRDAT